MPKKRSHIKNFKPSLTSSATQPVNGSEKRPKSVNERLANLRLATAGPSSSSRSAPANSPSVPPAIREILQIPETPTPAPRQSVRQRFDSNGRRLPAGPAPPRSWVVKASAPEAISSLSRSRRICYSGHDKTILPGSPLPQPGSLIDLVLKQLAADWDVHRVYNQNHLFFVPNHLKSALIRYVAIASVGGLTPADLKAILLQPTVSASDTSMPFHSQSSFEVACLDLSSSIGRSLKLRDVVDLLFNDVGQTVVEEPQESWEASDVSQVAPRVLLPNLTHLSLALDPLIPREASWRQLLTLSSKLPTITHLSLAYWPEPCLNPRSKYTTVLSPQGHKIAYGGTSIYSHSIDHDWSEALLVLRMLSSHLYKLEFLDLTGCAGWFEALRLKDGHDFVDWTGCWSKMSVLRLYTGWNLGTNAMVSDRSAYSAAVDTAKGIEKHIRSLRAGKGIFMTVERDDIVDGM